MKLKKLALLLIICSFFFTAACGNMFNPPAQGPVKEIPPGMGAFVLSVDGSNSKSRAIMPVDYEYDDVKIAGYSLSFRHITTLAEEHYFYLNAANKDDSVSLPAGTYDLLVMAYTEYSNKTVNEPVAKGTVSPMTIPAGETITCNVSLAPIIAEGGQGTFSWDLSFPYDDFSEEWLISEARMEISHATDSSFVPITLYFISSTETTISHADKLVLDSGHYRVIFTLEKESSRPVKWRETLHVYRNMLSHFAYDFSDYHFITQSYTLTLTNLYNSSGAPRPDEINTHFCDIPVSVPNPSRLAYQFNGWFTDAGFTSGNEWVNNSLLDKDTVLYAKWLAIPILVLDPSAVNLSMALADPVLPAPVNVNLINAGSAQATNISVSLSGANASMFSLNNHTSLSPIQPGIGNSKTFQLAVSTIPVATMTYRAVITVTYIGDDGIKSTSANVVLSVTDFQGTMTAGQMIQDTRQLVAFTGTAEEYGRYMQTVSGDWKSGEMVMGEAKIELTFGTNVNVAYPNGMQNNWYNIGTVGRFHLGASTQNGNERRTTFTLDLGGMQLSSVKTVITPNKGDFWVDINGVRGPTVVSSVTLDGFEGAFWCTPNTANVQFAFEIVSDGEWVYEEVTANPHNIFQQSGVTIYYWRTEQQSLDYGTGPGPGMWSWGETYFTKFDEKTSGADTVVFNTINIYEPGVVFVPGLGGTDVRIVADYNVPPVLGARFFDLKIGDAVIGQAILEVTGINGLNTTTGAVASVNLLVTYDFDPAFLPLVASYTSNITTTTGTWTGTAPNNSHAFTFPAKAYGSVAVNTVITFK